MEEKEKSDLILPIAIVVLLAIVVIYLITLGKVNFFGQDNIARKKDLEARKKSVDSRFERVNHLLQKKKQLKAKLDKVNRLVLLSARIVIVFIFLGICTVSKMVFDLSLLDITGYIGVLFLVLTLLAFIILGSPEKAIDFWNYIERKLTLKIYGKYINLEHQFEKHEKHKKSLDIERESINNEISKINNDEQEVLNVLSKE